MYRSISKAARATGVSCLVPGTYRGRNSSARPATRKRHGSVEFNQLNLTESVFVLFYS